MRQRLPALLLCLAFGITAFVLLDFWSARNAPLWSRLERQWSDDLDALVDSKKLPKEWFDVGQVEVVGGTPETKEWLARIQVPVHPRTNGKNKLDVLVVAWEEDGKRGALVQYNLVDGKTGNNIFELGRTYILSKPKPKDTFKALLEEFKQ